MYLTKSQVSNQSVTSSFMTEIFNGISTVKALGVEKDIYKNWYEIFNKQIKSSIKKSYFQLKIDLITNALFFIAPIIVTWIGMHQVIELNISLGTLFAFQSLTISFLTPLNSLASLINDAVTLETYLERIYDVLDEKAEQNENKIKLSEIKGNIILDNVSFKYTKYDKYILENISIEIKAGEKIAIVGRSGSGKSTLAALLVGLYNPTKGKIYFDGYDYNNMDKCSFRKKIGVVMQDNFLFNKTISDNIKLHMPEASDYDIAFATRLAEIDTDIQKMPMGYQTILSETGSNISGGQKQRIALARALISKPSILLLDEATSALDTITEKNIEKNIKSLNCTSIIIAHRLSTIINSDIIILIDNGKIISKGTHEELIVKSNYYKELYYSSFSKCNLETKKINI